MKLAISAVIGIACLGAAVQSQQKTPDTYEAFAQMPTGPGARNSRFVPEQNRLYVAVPAGKDGKPAKVQIYEVSK